MRSHEFVEELNKCGWEGVHDAQHERIMDLWARIFPSVADLEKEIPDLIETAHQAGQDAAGLEPSRSQARRYRYSTW